MSDMARMFFLAKAACSAPAPSDIVILPETELPLAEANDGMSMYYWGEPSPFENLPVAGNTYKINWGGVDYISKAVDVSSQSEAPAGTMLALGNTNLFIDMGVENPAPGAPYLLALMPTGLDGMHVQMMTNGITPDPPVLSIVQTEGSSTDSGNVGVTTMLVNIDVATMTIDKSYDAVLAALNDGIPVQFRVSNENNTSVLHLCEFGVKRIALVFCNFDVDKAWAGYVITPDGKFTLA